jgi:hypothetical protein
MNKSSVLTAFIWRRRLYRVTNTLGWWREPSEWWNGEPVRLLVRVTAANKATGIYDLCKIDSSWFLSRLLD